MKRHIRNKKQLMMLKAQASRIKNDLDKLRTTAEKLHKQADTMIVEEKAKNALFVAGTGYLASLLKATGQVK